VVGKYFDYLVSRAAYLISNQTEYIIHHSHYLTRFSARQLEFI